MSQGNSNDNSQNGKEIVDTVILIDTEDSNQHHEIDTTATAAAGKTAKKRLNINPAKAVIGGISQSANAVKQGANVVKGGISQVENGLTKVPGISQGVSIFADYRKFLDRGNVIDLAVAVVIGAAFTSIVDSLVKDIISPIVALASGKALEENFVVLRKDDTFANPDFSTRSSVKASNALSWNYGNFVQTVINFFIISACVFLIVKLYQMGRNTKTAVTEKKCPFCSGSIELNAVRCSKCTSWLDLDEYARAEESLARRLRDGPVPPMSEKEEYRTHDAIVNCP
ncbi:MAG: large-conductance mechanosensitive channel [Linnemannia gamsii]|nr:MAG: large-conductance mechanosensitive channel [Linnemannia gamsii]